MKISRDTLQKYFEKSLPDIAEIADAYTFHAFEIDSIEGDILDVKVLPNRAADCHSEAGLARELSAILEIPTTAPRPSGASLPPVTVSLAQINGILGSSFSASEVAEVFKRLGLETKVVADTFTVTPPASRPDITMAEDLVEEVGRMLGYDRVLATELPPIVGVPDQARFRGIERIRDLLAEHGFTEISTQSFAKKGEILLANPLDKTRPALRMNLEKGIKIAEIGAKQYAPLLFGKNGEPNLFEIGTVFTEAGEKLYLALSKPLPALNGLLTIEPVSRGGITHYDLSGVALEELGKDYKPVHYTLGTYKPFSLHPFIVRDIALWVPAGTKPEEVLKIIRKESGALLVRSDLFDTFEKARRISYAFRLVFQSFEKTLTDEEANTVMENVYAAVKKEGWEVR